LWQIFFQNLPLASEALEVTTIVTKCPDPKDNKLLSLAIDGGADAVVTADQDLLSLHPFQNIPVLSPKEFLQQQA